MSILIRPIIRPLLQPIGEEPEIDPAELFVGGVVGGGLDPYDRTTMRQNSDGTGAVTSDNDPIGWIQTKWGGSTITFIQPTSDSRPKWRTSAGEAWFEFDGTDDSWYSNANVDFSSVDEITFWAGISYTSGSTGIVFELTAISSSTNGSFGFNIPTGAVTDGFNWQSRGTTNRSLAVANSFIPPQTAALVLDAKISGPFVRARKDMQLVGNTTTSQGTGNYSNSVLYVGRRGNTTLPFNGKIHSLLFGGKNYSDDLAEKFSNWLLQSREIV